MAKLYTEWGIWLAQKRDDSSAEEKFLAVIKYNPKQIPAHTELGRLLSRQKYQELCNIDQGNRFGIDGLSRLK